IKLPASITNADSITFIDAQSWLLTGIQNNHEAPFVFTTNDAGITWHQHKLPVPNANKAFQTWQEGTGQFFSANEGLLTVRYLTKNGSPLANANAFSPTDSALAVYVTHDGGTSWSLLSSLQLAGEPQQGKYYSYGWPVFTDTQHGWIYQSSVTITGKELPASNRLLTTTDGGKNWGPILVKMPGGQAGQTVTPDNAWSSESNPYFISAKIGWLIGYYSPIKSDLLQNKLFKTIDGGQTWETVQYSIT
ncbi:MAG TPA: hypothetical protein VFN35_02335, partial [Ktedonobacteraceae bacterium]|nr:hypothetical protein [Ktedonobacteraceae bacterium]